MSRKMQIGVLGASSCGPDMEKMAYEVGKEIARQGAVLLCGGLGGVMEAASRGAKEAGGLTVGILPGPSGSEANPHISLRIATDMGHARNVVLVRSSDAVIAVSGGYGTLSELAIARKIGVPCIGLHTWDLDPGVVQADDAVQAVGYAVERIQERGTG
jgi:uncharacterized protein (TIGR00725 family)